MVTGFMNVTDILNYLAELGFFAYVLPFLLIFAVIFGILEKGHVLGTNRGVHVTIALAVGLLSLQFDYVSEFFATIFPYAGIGIGVVLVALILTGLIAGKEKDTKWIKYIWFGIGAIAFIAVLWASLDELSFLWGRGMWNLSEFIPILLILAAFGGLIVWMVKSSSSGSSGSGSSTSSGTTTP